MWLVVPHARENLHVCAEDLHDGVDDGLDVRHVAVLGLVPDIVGREVPGQVNMINVLKFNNPSKYKIS